MIQLTERSPAVLGGGPCRQLWIRVAMSQSSSSVQDVPRSTTRSNLSRPPCFCIILLASSSPTDACTWMSDHPGSFVESASVECMRISFQERPKSSSASPHIPGIPQISADDSRITSHVIINALTLCMFVKYVFFFVARCPMSPRLLCSQASLVSLNLQ